MFLNIRIDLLILRTYYGQFTLTTKKKSLHIIFKVQLEKDGFWHKILHWEQSDKADVKEVS